MTSEMSIGVRRGARVLTREELKRHFLALVLAAVLVWYTALVVPAHAKAFAARTPDDEGRDGEVREPRDGTSSRESVEDLDWPEYIFLD
jgi:hypothetical protein